MHSLAGTENEGQFAKPNILNSLLKYIKSDLHHFGDHNKVVE